MRILTFCDVDGRDITRRLGTPEYSYHFVLEAFLSALVRFADVERVYTVEEANSAWQRSQERKESCVLLSFTPPHKMPVGLCFPAIPVFAWEYPNLPAGTDEVSWLSDPRHDWASVLREAKAAITLSSHTVKAVKDSLGDDYPIRAFPTPLWEKFAAERARGPLPSNRSSVDILVDTKLVDSDLLGLSADGLVTDHPEDGTPTDSEMDAVLPMMSPAHSGDWSVDIETTGVDLIDLAPSADLAGSPPIAAGWDVPPQCLVRTRLKGVVYTAVLTPSDGRKNWEDVITAFGWAFRDAPDATLVLKLGGPKQERHHHEMLMLLTKLSPMKCRIVALHGFLNEADYSQLIGATTYYVNASLCEGLCMPLMEFLSSGIPAISPDHTAMADYISPEIAFIVDSSPGLPALWPHGDHQVDRTTRHQINWYSLMLAYRESYTLAKADPQKYAIMSSTASEKMCEYCSTGTIASQLQDFLADLGRKVFDDEATTPSQRFGR